MTLDQFRDTLGDSAPPDGLSLALSALWEDARGRWAKAHEIAQDIHSPMGSWIHAYLHRKEGDHSNAAYWYRRAGHPVPHDTLDQEWTRIVSAALNE